jgi:uncharacterized membrane protein YgdD (TMEM256/DUF423 family)
MGEATSSASRFWLGVAAANGLMAVAMGAFAAHGLRGSAMAGSAGWVTTASDYQMWHALALLALAALARNPWPSLLRAAAVAFLVGIVLFSGSLYLLALSGFVGYAWVTPLGGIAFLIGWALLLWHGIGSGRI